MRPGSLRAALWQKLRASVDRHVQGRVRSWVRDAGAELLYRTTLSHPGRFARDKLSVVTFHRVLPEPLLAQYPIPAIAVTPDELAFLLELFEQHYPSGTLAEVATRFALGDRPERPLLAITFDDGQRDNFEHARPVLTRLNVHASFFVVTDAIEHDQTLWHDRIAYALKALLQRERSSARRLLTDLTLSDTGPDPVSAAVAEAKRMSPEARERWLARLEAAHGGDARPSWDGMMRWHELATLHGEGHEIGSHSHSHAILPLISDSQLYDEVQGSRERLRAKLGFEIQSFCYPNGDHDPRTVQAVERAGYRHAVTTRYGLNPPDGSPFTWRRVDLQSAHAHDQHGEPSPGRVLLRLTGQLPTAY